MILFFSPDFSNRNRLSITEELNQTFAIHQADIMRFNIENAPLFLQLIGSANEWRNRLKDKAAVIADIILKKVRGKVKKDGLWSDKTLIKTILDDPSGVPFREVATILTNINQSFQKDLKIIFGIPTPTIDSRTFLTIESGDKMYIAWSLVNFVNKVTTIEDTMKKQSKLGNRPMGSVRLKFQSDGSLKAKWKTLEHTKLHEIII